MEARIYFGPNYFWDLFQRKHKLLIGSNKGQVKKLLEASVKPFLLRGKMLVIRQTSC